MRFINRLLLIVAIVALIGAAFMVYARGTARPPAELPPRSEA